VVNIHENLSHLLAGMQISIILFRESNLKSYPSLVRQDLLNLLGISAGNGWDTTHRIGQYCRLSFTLIGSFYPSPTLPSFLVLFSFVPTVERALYWRALYQIEGGLLTYAPEIHLSALFWLWKDFCFAVCCEELLWIFRNS